MDRARPERAALLRRAPAMIAAIEARSEDALTGDVTSALVLTARTPATAGRILVATPAPPDARHHTACVTAMAASLVG